MPRFWIGNPDEALPGDDLFFARYVDAKTMRMCPRFLLCLEPGDCLVVPVAIPEDFSRYIARLLRLGDPRRIVLQVEKLSSPFSLVESLLGDPDAMAAIAARAREGGWSLEPFIETPRILDLAAAARIPADRTEPRLIRSGLIRDLNDKAWFKGFASAHGVRTVPGGEADSTPALEQAIQRMAGEYPELMLRKTYYAGGAGSTHGSGPDLLAQLGDWYNAGTVLVEPFLDIASVAGSLAYVGPSGVRFIGIDQQVMRDVCWSGFDYPYPPGTGATRVREFTIQLAEAIRESGARGYLNLDWAFLAGSPDDPVALECNFRHNGFAYITEFAEKYFGPGWDRLVIHSREDLATTAQGTGELLERLSRLRLKGEPVLLEAPGAARGAVITAPAISGTFSVAIFSDDRDFAREALALVEEAA